MPSRCEEGPSDHPPMRVRFWGTRGSIATPGASTTRFGGNTSCVEMTTDAGDLLIFDCGTGARALGIELMAGRAGPVRGSILFTHTHWDHIQGFPFFTPAFIEGNEFSLYGPVGSQRSLHDVLAGQMRYAYFPVELGQLPARISCHELGEGAHRVGGARILTQYLHHTAMTIGYRVEADGVAVVYLLDHEPFLEALWRRDAEPGRIESMVHPGDIRHARFMAGADLVIHDAQYTPEEYGSKKNWGHSPYTYVIEVAAAAGVRRLVLTHHDPMHDDRRMAQVEQSAQAMATQLGSSMEVACAYEGWALQVAPGVPTKLQDVEAVAVSTAASNAGGRVLVVDDEVGIRELVGIALRQEGFQVALAGGGAEALELVETFKPDLMLLDWMMPVQTGAQVLTALRARPTGATLPVVVLTAMGDELTTRTGFEAGATDVMAKPFSIPQLTARIRACIARAPKPSS